MMLPGLAGSPSAPLLVVLAAPRPTIDNFPYSVVLAFISVISDRPFQPVAASAPVKSLQVFTCTRGHRDHPWVEPADSQSRLDSVTTRSSLRIQLHQLSRMSPPSVIGVSKAVHAAITCLSAIALTDACLPTDTRRLCDESISRSNNPNFDLHAFLGARDVHALNNRCPRRTPPKFERDV